MFLSTIEVIMPAIIVGIMILITHIAFGVKVLQRGIIFIDLAIAQAAGFGLIMADILHIHNKFSSDLIAIICAVIAGLLFFITERKMPKYQEAFIGIFYVMTASLSLLMLSQASHGAEKFSHLLSGEILFVTWQDIIYHLPIYLLVMLICILYSKALQGLTFYILFALIVTSSVQLIGIFTVFIALIVPALMLQLTGFRMIWGYISSIIFMIMGLLISLFSDYPASSCIILMIIAGESLIILLAKRK